MRALILAALLATGCAPPQGAASPFGPNCTETALAEIEGKFVAEVLYSCGDHKSMADVQAYCEAWPEIDARYSLLRQSWIDCGASK